MGLLDRFEAGRAPLVALLAVVSVATAPAAEGARDLESLFPYRAEVRAEGAGLVRLTLPADVLAACKRDLSDLRLVDPAGREIAYLIDSGLPADRASEVLKTFEPSILGARRDTQTRDGAPAIVIETYVIEAPAQPPEGGAWTLVVSASRSRFVRRVTVSAGDPEAGGRVLISDASIFRLADPPRERLGLSLPARSTLEGGELTVTLVGEGDDFLEPAFAFEARRRLPETEHATVGLDVVESQSLDGRTRVRLERPRGLVPDTLRIETSSPALHRRVEVWDEGAGSSAVPLADETIQRLSREETIEIRLRPATGTRLEVVLHDGGSPPLEDLGFEAIVRRPALVFAVPEAAETSGETYTATLLYGGGRAYPPRYDLGGLVPDRTQRLSGDRAVLAERLFDPERLSTATLGARQDNPEFDPSPALSFAMRPGVALNPRLFRHRVTVRAGSSPEGLLRVRIPPRVSADSRADLGDLRLVDQEQRQWSYLLERAAAPAELSISPIGPQRGKDGTRYELPLPVTPLRVDQLVLDPRDEFFDRGFEVVGRRLDGQRGDEVLAAGRLARPLGDPRKVRIDLPDDPIESLELVIDDGDDPPLDLEATAIRIPVAVLYFAAPAGRYELLYGNPEETAPRYELESVREVVLAAQGVDADLGQPETNPAFSIGARLSKGRGLHQALLWIALAVAVAVLAWLTLRLARQE